MVIIKVSDKKWEEHKIFIENLDIYLDSMKDNDDLVFVIDGPERAGKSKRARQIGKYCAEKLGSTFNDNNIKFDLKSYLDFSIESPEYTVCILDEARNVLNRKSSMSKANRKFTNYISECAKKRQVHIICLPAYHDLDRYIVLWRMKFVMHIRKWYDKDDSTNSGYKLSRGEYKLYMNDNYLKDCYNYPYRYPKRFETIGRFYDIEVLKKEELEKYEKNKDDNMYLKYHSDSEEKQLNKLEKMWRTRTVKMIKYNLDGVTCPNCNYLVKANKTELSNNINITIDNMNKILLRHGQIDKDIIL